MVQFIANVAETLFTYTRRTCACLQTLLSCYPFFKTNDENFGF